jgi:hypothetical protein
VRPRPIAGRLACGRRPFEDRFAQYPDSKS